MADPLALPDTPDPAGALSEIGHLKQTNLAVTEALRSVEAMAWLDIDPASDLAEVCQVLAGKVRDTGDIRHVGIFLMNPDTFQFDLTLSVPEEAAPQVRREFEEQIGAGMIGWTVRERRLAVVPALTLPAGAGEQSIILLPVSTPRQVWGLVICFCAHGHERLPQNTLRLLNIVANHFGMALENAALLRTLSDQNRNLESIVQARSAELLAKKKDLEEACADLRRMDAAKNDFISLVAHELRTPLTGILSFSEFLAEEGLSPEEIKEFAGSIHREATRLHRLVNDVLDLAKMEAGKLSYTYDDEDLNEVAELSLTSIAAAARKRNIRISLQKAPGLPSLRLAHDRIQQVILNMLSNAMKYSDDGGEIIIKTEAQADGVCLSVQDFGAGIAARDIPKVFNKFEQIEDVKHHSEGTGFGMPIAKNIVEVGHKGKMWVTSEGRGKGSTFYFTLPRQAAAAVGTESREAPGKET